MRFVYSIVRFVPDPARGEFINIGTIAGSDETSEWETRIVTNKRRARSLDSSHILANVLGAVENLERRIDHANAGLPLPDEDPVCEKWLARLATESNNVLQFSAPAPMIAETIEEVLEVIDREMIVDPATVPHKYKNKTVAFARARSAYLEAGLREDTELLERVEVISAGAHYRDNFDFVVANGSAVQLAQAWSFQLPDQDELVRDLKSWAWTVRDMRAQVSTASSGERVIIIPKDVDVAAIYIPTQEPGVIFEVADALCRAADVRLVALSDVAPLVAAKARELLIARAHA
jgi:hypothetical protein